MSRTIRQTAFSGLLGSKRFIVSVCAAIAMVLGAMSVGASIFVPHSAADSGQQAANAPIFTERGGNASSNPSKENGGRFTRRHTLIPNTMQPNPATPPPSSANPLPKVKASLGIKFGPVNVTTGINLGDLQIKVESSLTPAIETPPLPVQPIETPAVEVDPPKTQEELPKEQEPPADPQPAAEEEMAPLSITSSAISEEPMP